MIYPTNQKIRLSLSENKHNLTPNSFYTVILVKNVLGDSEFPYFGVINNDEKLVWIYGQSCNLEIKND